MHRFNSNRATFRGHNQALNFVAWSPDGKRIASGDVRGVLKAWNVNDGTELFSRNGPTIQRENPLRLADGRPVPPLTQQLPITMASFRDDGRIVCAYRDGSLNAVHGKLGDEISSRTIPNGGPLCLSTNGKWFVAAQGAGLDAMLAICDSDTGDELSRLEGAKVANVMGLAFAPSGIQLFGVDSEGRVQAWIIKTGELVLNKEAKLGPGSHVLAVSQDASRLAITDGVDVRVFDAATGAHLITCSGHGDQVAAVAFNHEGTRIASGSTDETAKLWEVKTGELVRTFKGHRGRVSSISFSPTDSVLASGSDDGTIKTWDLREEEVTTLRGHTEAITSIALSSDHNWVLTKDKGGALKIWSAKTWKLEHALQHFAQREITGEGYSHMGGITVGHNQEHDLALEIRVTGDRKTYLVPTDRIEAFAFSPDGRILAVSNNSTADIWSAQDGVRRRRIELQNAGVAPQDARLADICFSSTGELIACTYRKPQNLLVISSLVTEKEVQRFTFCKEAQRAQDGSIPGDTLALAEALAGDDKATPLEFSKSGARFLCGCRDGTVGVWDLATRYRIVTCKGHTQSDDATFPVHFAMFSPIDQNRIVSAGADKTVRLWDATTGEELLVLRGHDGPVECVAFGPQGRFLVSGSSDRTATIWSAGP